MIIHRRTNTTAVVILLIVFGTVGLVSADASNPFAHDPDDLPWRSFYPVFWDELDLAAQLLEENCYEPRFIVPRTERPSTTVKRDRVIDEFVMIGKHIDDCTVGRGAARDLGQLLR